MIPLYIQVHNTVGSIFTQPEALYTFELFERLSIQTALQITGDPQTLQLTLEFDTGTGLQFELPLGLHKYWGITDFVYTCLGDPKTTVPPEIKNLLQHIPRVLH